MMTLLTYDIIIDTTRAEFPSLSWLAQTSEAALKGVSALVHEVTADMHKNG